MHPSSASNRRFDLAIFDLDGTLIDSQLDLANSVNATLENFKMAPLPHEIIASYVGNGAPVLIRRAIGPDASQDLYEQALAFFINYYAGHSLDATRLYPGAEETLGQLHQTGVQLAVLTNKPVRISNSILDGLAVNELFFRVYGGNSFPDKKPHPVGILELLRESGCAPERTLMVGDTSVDIETARNASVHSCGMRYGFRPHSLTNPAPDYLLDDFPALRGIILKDAAW